MDPIVIRSNLTRSGATYSPPSDEDIASGGLPAQVYPHSPANTSQTCLASVWQARASPHLHRLATLHPTHLHSQQQVSQYQCTLIFQQTHYKRVWQVRAWLQSHYRVATVHQTHFHSHQQARSLYRQLHLLRHSPMTTQRPSAQNYVRSWQRRRILHQLCTRSFTSWGSLKLTRYHTSRSTSYRRSFRRANSHGSSLLQHRRQDSRLELHQPSP